MCYRMFPWCVFLVIYVQWYYYAYIVGAFTAYPEPVAVELRKALWYTNQALDPPRAQKHYIKAQRIAIEQENMDPFSDAIIGIRIMYAKLFEKCQDYQKAISVYEHIFAQNLQWLEQVGIREGWEGRRNKVLMKTVQVAYKLGEVYAGPHVMERDLAEEKLTWGVQTSLEETLRRERDGVKEGEGDWLPREQTGAALERMYAGMVWE